MVTDFLSLSGMTLAGSWSVVSHAHIQTLTLFHDAGTFSVITSCITKRTKPVLWSMSSLAPSPLSFHFHLHSLERKWYQNALEHSSTSSTLSNRCPTVSHHLREKHREPHTCRAQAFRTQETSSGARTPKQCVVIGPRTSLLAFPKPRNHPSGSASLSLGSPTHTT